MNWEILLGNLAYTAAGIVLMFVGLRTFDRLTPVNFAEEIKKQNMALAVIIAAFLLSVAYIIGRSLN
jgi:uncharacterized membrane protein YjfL (UPF0719 family)